MCCLLVVTVGKYADEGHLWEEEEKRRRKERCDKHTHASSLEIRDTLRYANLALVQVQINCSSGLAMPCEKKMFSVDFMHELTNAKLTWPTCSFQHAGVGNSKSLSSVPTNENNDRVVAFFPASFPATSVLCNHVVNVCVCSLTSAVDGPPLFEIHKIQAYGSGSKHRDVQSCVAAFQEIKRPSSNAPVRGLAYHPSSVFAVQLLNPQMWHLPTHWEAPLELTSSLVCCSRPACRSSSIFWTQLRLCKQSHELINIMSSVVQLLLTQLQIFCNSCMGVALCSPLVVALFFGVSRHLQLYVIRNQ